ncbi:MAG: sigma-70 family RNA polymerase sigma factor [Candidatus Limivivens sp.]|nr:sigma-70 family RNA polymerase sigma factor [Candidatus Limivivens sp.]
MRKNQTFSTLYAERKNLIIKYIYDRIGEHEDAVEMSQDVFMAFYQKMSNVDEDMYKSWLLLAARNACIDYYRKRSIRKETAFSEWLESTEIMAEDNLEMVVERVIREEFAYRILGELKQKNTGWYEVIEAISIYGMSQDEAAKHLGVTVQVLRSRLYRARKFVRRKYLKEYQEL